MGFLENLGRTFSIEESMQYQALLKEYGLEQLIKLLSDYKSKENSESDLLWGDEIELFVLKFDHTQKRVYVHLDADEIMEEDSKKNEQYNYMIQPEYGAWMLETIPKNPYIYNQSLQFIIQNLKERRREISKILNPKNLDMIIIPAFPLLGVGQFWHSEQKSKNLNEKNEAANSLFVSDRIITDHPRFPTLSKNIRDRRGGKIEIKMPLYKDKYTDQRVEKSIENPYIDTIFMDAPAFAMGNCALQVTVSPKNMKIARHLYDQLATIGPIMTSLSAGTPILRGLLSDYDVRLQTIEHSMDDRSAEEKDPNSTKFIPKSRYSSISLFISNLEENNKFREEYNDLKYPLNTEIMELAKKISEKYGTEIDAQFLNHLGFLYSRDLLVIYEKAISQDLDSTAHFENIQSTNWNYMRFKPPPTQFNVNNSIGWRVEFRSMEAQLTDEENGIFIFLVHCFSVILEDEDFNLNFYIPISKVDENIQRSYKRDSIINQKFFFRKNMFEEGPCVLEEYSMDELLFGSENFRGFYKVFELYKQWKLNSGNTENPIVKNWDSLEAIFNEFLKKKVNGEMKTLAKFQREFVLNHPLYREDSIVSPEIAYDLLNTLNLIAQGKLENSNFKTPLGKFENKEFNK